MSIIFDVNERGEKTMRVCVEIEERDLLLSQRPGGSMARSFNSLVAYKVGVPVEMLAWFNITTTYDQRRRCYVVVIDSEPGKNPQTLPRIEWAKPDKSSSADRVAAIVNGAAAGMFSPDAALRMLQKEPPLVKEPPLTAPPEPVAKAPPARSGKVAPSDREPVRRLVLED